MFNLCSIKIGAKLYQIGVLIFLYRRLFVNVFVDKYLVLYLRKIVHGCK